uniref:Uncharacterized protein n=1 Tax=Monopterus albus TaxID=43700 RepID=A0A3Q3K9K3_MONAL
KHVMFQHFTGLLSLDNFIPENLWVDLNRAVHSRQPSNLVDLEQVCHEQWVKITPEKIQMLFRGYPKRLVEVTEDK